MTQIFLIEKMRKEVEIEPFQKFFYSTIEFSGIEVATFDY